MMLRRVGVIFLSVVLILSISAVHSAGESFVPKTPTEGWRKLTETPLPQGLEDWKWAGAFDFAELRDVWLPTMGAVQVGAYVVLGVSLSLLVTWAIVKLLAIKGGWTAMKAAEATLGQSVWGDIIGGSAASIYALMNPLSLPQQAQDLKTELGISDYYVFGQAMAVPTPGYTAHAKIGGGDAGAARGMDEAASQSSGRRWKVPCAVLLKRP